MKILDGSKLPDFSFNDVHLNDNKFYIIEDSKDVKMSVQTNRSLIPTIRLEADDLEAGFTSTNFSEGMFFFSAKSRVEAKMKKVKLSVEIDVVSQVHDRYEKTRTLAFKVKSVQVTIPPEHMDITIHGNIFSRMANAFKGLFISNLNARIEQYLEKRIRYSFGKYIHEVNKMTRSQDQHNTFQTNTISDWRLSAEPFLLGDSIHLHIRLLQPWSQDWDNYFPQSFAYLPLAPRQRSQRLDQFHLIVSALSDYPQREEQIQMDHLSLAQMIDSSSHLNIFQLFRVQHPEHLFAYNITDKYTHVYGNAQFVQPDWYKPFIPQTLPHMGGEWTFWHEHIDSNDVYSRKLAKPITYSIHKWLTRYFDNYGIMAFFDKMLLPYAYWAMGEKDPDVEDD